MTHKLGKAAILPWLLAAAGAPLPALAREAPPVVGSPADARLGETGGLAAPRLEHAPRTLGPYRLLRELGSGGMGSVYLAESSDALRRRVALKVIRDGLFAPALLARFEVERRALAAADHDFVARLFESGTTDDGRPWLAMEYVDGESITEFCDRRGLDVEARLELFVDVCAAVQHLHQRGVLHGDLKPANILVSERDGRAVPKIIDLGLARTRTSAGEDTDTVMGTPAYMAPEHFALPVAELDARSDVFALGVLLRELLVGATPEAQRPRGIAGAALRAASAPPSDQLRELGSVAESVARRRATRVARLRRRLRGNLDRITQRSMEPEREWRHGSAAELARDVRRDLRRQALLDRSLRLAALVSSAAALGFAGGLLAAAAG